jgi:hypothetical protein
VALLLGATLPALLIGWREGGMVYTWQQAWGKWYRYVDCFRDQGISGLSSSADILVIRGTP